MSPLISTRAGASAQGYGFGLPSGSIFGATPLIWTQLSTTQTNIDIQDIPQTYSGLRVVFVVRNTGANFYQSNSLEINNSSSTLYARYAMGNQGTNAGDVYWTGANGQTIDTYHYSRGASAASDYFGINILDFYNYSNTTQTKNYLSTYHDSNNLLNGSTFYDNGFSQYNASEWASTNAINRLTFYGTFAAGTTIAVIGYKKGI